MLLFPDAGHERRAAVASRRSDADFSECEVIVEERIVNQRLTAAPIEPRSGAAHWTDDGRLVHYSACQGAHPTQDLLVGDLRPRSRAGASRRARCRWRLRREVAHLSRGARDRLLRAGRSAARCKWTETRSENMVAMPHGRGQVQRAKLGGTRDGRITAYHLDVVQDAGAFPLIGAMLPMMTMRMVTGVYEIPNVSFNGSQRGDERGVDDRLPRRGTPGGGGRDRAHGRPVRRGDRHGPGGGAASQPRPEVHRSLHDRHRHRVRRRRLPRGARARARRRRLRRRCERSRRAAGSEGDPVALGIGIAVYVEITAGAPGSEFGCGRAARRAGGCACAAARRRSGRVTTRRGRWWCPSARACRSSTSRSSTATPTRCGPGASRSDRARCRSAARRSTPQRRRSVDLARERAADLLECAVDDVVLDVERARVPRRGHAGRGRRLGAIAASRRREPLAAECDFTPVMPTFPFGAHLAVVEVDTETGHTRLTRLVAVDDAGKLLNPLLAEGQVHGGIAQGVAQALFEAVRYSDDGQPQTTNFARLPRDLGGRAAVVRGRAHGDADVRQPARRQGRRRVGHDRRDPRRVQRGHRRARRTSASATSRRRSRRSVLWAALNGSQHRNPTDASLGYARTTQRSGGDRLVDTSVHEGRRRAPASAISC